LHDVTSPSARPVPTASQTVGPFFSIGLCPGSSGNLVPTEIAAGSKVVSIRGRLWDGDGQAVPDAVLEIWRANDRGKYAGSEDECDAGGFPRGFARIPTGELGEFEFATLKPGPTTGDNGEVHAPHLTVLIFMRGLLRHLVTRIYFSRHSANARDPVLRAVPEGRRDTLMAMQIAANENELRWDVYLQGDTETVFFEA
jgi:protocatechuate 3,4-dioxygenase, alpha subunit